MSDTKKLHHHPKGAVAHFQDPKTGSVMWVVPRRNEDPQVAIDRVAKQHGISDFEVKPGVV